MICINIILTGREGKDPQEIRSLLAEQGRLSRAEPGCLRFEVYHSKNDPRVFILNERWESAEALDVHRTAKAYTEIYQPQVLPNVQRVPHPSALVA